MKNSYFSNSNPEQSLVDDLTIESIKMHGEDMIYVPRTLVNEDKLFGEDTVSKFDNGHSIEMYIESVDGFEGDGDLISRFGLEIRDSVNLILSKTRFEETFSDMEAITRPREGDLVYFPLSKGLFEVKFVEHSNPFYQLGKLYTYRLSCELFRYNQEELNSGFSEVDKIEHQGRSYTTDGIGNEVIMPNDGFGNNADIDVLDDDIVDFSESNPFSENDFWCLNIFTIKV